MSHINDALKKAQKERDARYLKYGSILSTSGGEKGLFRGRIIWWSVFLFILFVVAFLSYSSLGSKGRKNPVISELRHDERPARALKPASKPTPMPVPKPEAVDNAKALYDSARDFHQSGRLQRARRLYEETLRLDPTYVDALNNLGVIYIHEKDFPAAQRSFEKAVRLNPGYVDAYYNLACLFAITGDAKESLLHLRKAVSLKKEVRDWAREDSDLENLRSMPEFVEIVGGKGSGGAVEEKEPM